VIKQSPEPSEELLHRILSVTDADLSHLDIDALFKELLDRVSLLLEAQTAAIMLLDQDAWQLVTVAAIGLEEEIRQGFRLDVGAGFAGRVAATRRPVIIDRVDADSVASSILRGTGVTSLVGVPMIAGGELVGVLHVGTCQLRTFTEEDVALLQLVADRAAMASQASQHRTDRTATLALQRSLLPSRLPRIEGAELAARYLPGDQLGVGGDWYDVFVLPSNDLGVVVGDVSGHGLRSAVVMGRLRSALRAYALIEEDPAAVLTLLDRKIQHFEPGNLATVLYAKLGPERDRIVVSSAGHLPPIIARPGRRGRPVSVPTDLPVGIGDLKPRQSTAVRLKAGSTVVLFTDGLVERRGQVIDDGLQRLGDQVAAERPEAVCDRIVSTMDVDQAEDDIALLAIHTIP
jgi:serine phosphatase RsbU (regulator of sigma subunit)